MGTRLTVGVNDLATLYPALALEWDYEKNAPLTPQEVVAGSHSKAFWLCPVGHSYEATIKNRSLNGTKCPFCGGKTVLAGFNDLATLYPALALEWDYEKNAPLTPQEVLAGSHSKAYWLCSKGHSSYSVVKSRTAGRNCGVCAGKAVLAGFNDLATTNPALALEWDYEKNAPLTPQEVVAGSNKKVWWLCSKGHSYQSLVNDRNNGIGCHYCSNLRVLAGFNDLATTNPALALEWDYEKNAPLTPQEVVAGSPRNVWWLCPKQHSYKASLNNRKSGMNCGICDNKTVLAGFNDLATTNPALALEWDYEKNAPLTPQQVSSGVPRKVWWLCSEGHSYFSTVGARNGNNTGCPTCANSGYDATRTGLFYFIQNQTLQARKVGITNPDRNKGRVEGFGADWQVIKTYTHEDGLLVRDLETLVLRWLRKDMGLPPFLGKAEMGHSGGQSETFSMEGPSDFEVLTYIENTQRRLIAENEDAKNNGVKNRRKTNE